MFFYYITKNYPVNKNPPPYFLEINFKCIKKEIEVSPKCTLFSFLLVATNKMAT